MEAEGKHRDSFDERVVKEVIGRQVVRRRPQRAETVDCWRSKMEGVWSRERADVR